jgi:endonuclease YncB( thermonuclease family)
MTMRPMTVASWIAVALLAQAMTPAHAEILKGRASVTDGDSIEIHGQAVRLLDMDAPEPEQLCRGADGTEYRCGERAASVLSDFLAQREVTCDWANLDRQGRRLARCTIAGQDLGLWMVEQGWALPARDCKCETYRAAAERAKTQKLGLWSGFFDMPWGWRARTQ